MMISEEQARLAAENLRSPGNPGPALAAGGISPELMQRVMIALASQPETRQERVREAQLHLESGALTSDAVADKMIARIVSDSLR